MRRAAGTTWSCQHQIYQRGWRQLTALRQCQQGTCREVTTGQPHGPAVSQTALPWPSRGLQRVYEKGRVPNEHCSFTFYVFCCPSLGPAMLKFSSLCTVKENKMLGLASITANTVHLQTFLRIPLCCMALSAPNMTSLSYVQRASLLRHWDKAGKGMQDVLL